MSLKSRILKLEAKVRSDGKDMIVLFIDDICTFENVTYTYEEFCLKYPNFRDDEVVEIK